MPGEVPLCADVVIIGAGITGTCAAWHLARNGAGQVVVLDSGTIAAGSSGRTGALLRQHYSNPWEAQLAHLGQQTFANWGEVVGGDCGFVPSGIIVTVDTGPGCEPNRDKLQRNVALQKSLGIDARVISSSELLALQPFVVTDDSTGVAYEPTSGYVDSVAATRSMARAAINAGATVLDHCPVTVIRTDANRVTGVTTAAGTIATRTVIVAAGPWSAKLLTTAGVDLPVTPIRVQIAIVHRPLELEQPHLVFIDTAAGMFCRPWAPGRSLIGVGVGFSHDPVDPDNYDERCDREYPAAAIAAVSRRIPAMAHATFVYGVSCLYDMSPDAHPIIGNIGIEGLIVAAGFSGAGFKKGPAVGLSLSELVLHGAATTVDISRFALERFQDSTWQEPWSDTEYTFTSDFGHKL